MAELVRYHFPTTIDFGPGASEALGDVLRAAGCTRPLIVTDRDVAALPFTDRLRAASGAEIFSEIWGNPVRSQVEAGVAAARAVDADAVIALGGGAPMDVAKVVALMLHHPGDLWDYEDGRPDARPVDQALPFIVAIPTTAGTGSEVGRSSVISEDASKVKRIIFHPRLLPRHVLVDPELTLGLPATITAATGADALTHLVEAFLAPGTQPLCDGIALEGVRLVAQSLEAACRFASSGAGADPEHLRARGDMMNAALMGAVAFQKGLGVTHSCAHALSTLCDLHHGLANGILVPHVMRFNAPAAEAKLSRLAAVVGRTSSAGFLDWLCALLGKVGIPRYLGEVGVGAEQLDRLVELAVADPCHQTNVCPVTADDIRGIYQRALAPEAS